MYPLKQTKTQPIPITRTNEVKCGNLFDPIIRTPPNVFMSKLMERFGNHNIVKNVSVNKQ